MPSPPPPSAAAQVGSGADQLRLGPYFTDRIPAAELAAEVARAAMEDRVALRDAEHAFYYRAFRAAFPAGLPGLPERTEYPAEWLEFMAELTSHQHPDHDTETWPPAKGHAT